jgi:ADP-heptose:LPS heptosyltransferase
LSDALQVEIEPGDRLLWIRFWAFGDALEAAANACNFKRRFPDVHLTFLSHPEYTALFRSQPYIDTAIAGRRKPLAEWWRTLRKIRAGGYRWLVSAQHGGRTSLLARFSRASRRIGHSSLCLFNRNYHLSLDAWARSCGLDVSDRSSPAIFAAAEDREAGRALLERLPERRLFVLIGAGNVDKMWRTGQWIEFLRPLAAGGWGIVLNGHGPLEEAVGRQIEEAVASPNLLNLVGALDFRKMAGVAVTCTLALGNDTGPLHLAALSGVPTMGLFSRSTSRSMGLRMPWFREFCAEDWLRGNKNERKNRHGRKQIPLKALPAEPVLEAFNAFAEAWADKRQGNVNGLNKTMGLRPPEKTPQAIFSQSPDPFNLSC